MGLLQAGIGALSGVLADQWREYFYCESMPENVLMVKGSKRTGGNNKGRDNVISNGSIVAVNEGQCMMIVQQGAIVEYCAEPGEFVWDSSTEPSIFYGGTITENLKAAWEELKKRFTFGGDVGKDQRVYYFNTKEIMGNKYGTANPVPFRVVDTNAGIDFDIGIKCFGEYSYKMTNPMLFYKNISSNIEDVFYRDRIDSQLKSEVLTALQPAFAKISAKGVRYSAVPGHTEELAAALNEVLSDKWGNYRGLSVVSFGVSSITANEEDEKLIQQMQKAAAMKNPAMANAYMATAAADAMQAAAKNENGAMMGFMGMNMAQNAGGMNMYQMNQGYAQQAPAAAPVQGGWDCACGAKGNTGKFCGECGQPKPQKNGWTCACGSVNKGKFCPECGAKKPADAPLYRCDKCGWEPEDPKNPPKFCPECGDKFDEGDVK